MTRNRFLILVLVAICTIRLAFLTNVMTTVDDIGPLVQLTQSEETGMVSALHQIGGAWSYAPAQFALTKPLLSLADDYRSAVFWGRLPSLMFWVAGIAAAFRLFLHLFADNKNGFALALLLTTLLVVSWRGLIESSQAYNYATTLPIAAAFVWMFCFPGKRHPFLTGVLLGLLTWLSYQAIFLAAAWFIAWLSLVARDRKKSDVIRWLMAACGFAVPLTAVFLFSLRLWAKGGMPYWVAGDIPINGALSQLTFVPRAWFAAIQNTFTFLPWGAGSVLVAVSVLVAIGAGVALGSGERSDPEKRFIVLVASIIGVWTVGALLGRFPLGSTRHSYILQLPLVTLLGVALSALKPSSRVLYVALAVVITLFGSFVPVLHRSVVSHVSAATIEAQAKLDPSALIINPTSSFTWDQVLISKGRPELRGRVFPSEWQTEPPPSLVDQFRKVQHRFFGSERPAVYEADNSNTWDRVVADLHGRNLILVSHRAPLTEADRRLLQSLSFRKIRAVTEIFPVGSTELSGNINGGNGFFVYVAEH